MSEVVNPMRTVCLASLAWTWCWCVIAGSVGLNALIESNRDKSRIRSLVPSPGVAQININDVLNAGIVMTTVDALISVLIFNFISLSLLPKTRSFMNKTLRHQAFTLLFCSIWLFACLIPFTYFYGNRSASVRVFIGKTELPQATIQHMAESFGISSVYKEIKYLTLVVAFAWISWVFTTITAVVLLMASGKVQLQQAPVASIARSSDEKNAMQETSSKA